MFLKLQIIQVTLNSGNTIIVSAINYEGTHQYATKLTNNVEVYIPNLQY